MKKRLVVLMAVFFACAFIACGNNNSATTPSGVDLPTSSTDSIVEPASTEDFSDPTKKVKEYILNGDYKKAAAEYADSIQGNAINESAISSWLKETASQTIEDYNNDGITYNQAKLTLSTIEKSEILPQGDTTLFDNQRDLEELYQSKQSYSNAETALLAKDFITAIKNYSKVAEIDSFYVDAQTKLISTADELEIDRIAAINALNPSVEDDKAVKDAIEIVDNTISVATDCGIKVPKVEAMRGQLIDLLNESSKKSLIDEAQGYIAAGDLFSAMEILPDGYFCYDKTTGYTYWNQDDPDVNSLFDKAFADYEKGVISESKALLSDKKYSEAISKLQIWENTAYDSFYRSPGDDVKKLNEDIKKTWCDAVIKKSEKNLSKSDYDNAYNVLLDAYYNDFIEDKSRITNQMDRVDSFRPYVVGGQFWEKYIDRDNSNSIYDDPTWTFSNNEGNSYNNALVFYNKRVGLNNNAYGYREYMINASYCTVEGFFSLSNSHRDDTGNKACLKIYGDNALLYESQDITPGILPIAFSVDITGVYKIRFEVAGSWAYESNYGIYDVVFKKQYSAP